MYVLLEHKNTYLKKNYGHSENDILKKYTPILKWLIHHPQRRGPLHPAVER